MADKVIGLDIGTSAVRAVALGRGHPPRLEHFGQVDLPPGVVADGEVVDTAAVASALRQLWKEAGFKGRSVRLAIASPRVIVRTVEMPRMSDGDTRAALELQLGDYIPMAPEATVFDVQPLAGPAEEEDHHVLLLAAAPLDAVRPVLEAVKQAGLRAEHVDVAASALARLVPPGRPEGPPEGTCDVIASIGAGAIVVTALNQGGAPVFSRTITNVAGRHVTERIANDLAIPAAEAERLKRHVPEHESADVAARVLMATDPFVTEICEEIGDSLDYFARLPGGMEAGCVAITGGGALLTGVRERLERRLQVPVRLLDTFGDAGIATTSVPPAELMPVAPLFGLATGAALAGERTRVRQINLLPDGRRRTSSSRTKLLVAGLAAVVVVGAGVLYLREGSALSDAEARRTELQDQVAVAQAAAAALNADGPAATSGAEAVWLSVKAGDIDWATVVAQLNVVSEPLGVGVTSYTGASSVNGDTTDDTTPTTVADASATTGTTVVKAATGTGTGIAKLDLTGTAADLNTIAAWIDAVIANDRFDDAWVSAITTQSVEDGGGLTFTATVALDPTDVVPRPHLTEVAP